MLSSIMDTVFLITVTLAIFFFEGIIDNQLENKTRAAFA